MRRSAVVIVWCPVVSLERVCCMRLLKSSAVMAAAVSAILGAGAHVASGAETVLRLASIDARAMAASKILPDPFAPKVGANAGGRTEGALKPRGGYGKPAALFAMVEPGDIEIAATVQRYGSGRFPRSLVMEPPPHDIFSAARLDVADRKAAMARPGLVGEPPVARAPAHVRQVHTAPILTPALVGANHHE